MTSEAASERPYHHGNLKAALLAAAEEELNKTGLESFSLRRVARRAGVSHNAPAHHFTDVTGLLTALATVGFERLQQVQTAHQKKAAQTDLEQLIALGAGYVDFATAHPALFRLMFSSGKPDRADPDLAAAMSATLDRLAQATRNARNKGAQTGPVNMQDLVAAWAIVHGLADLMNSGFILDIMDASGTTRDEAIRSILMLLDFD